MSIINVEQGGITISLADRILQSILKFPEQTIIFHDQEIKYSHLWDQASILRQALQESGVKPGDRIAIQLPKCLEFLYFHLANLQLGSITVPLNPTYTREEITCFLSDSKAKIFIATPDNAAKIGAILPMLAHLQHVIAVGASESLNNEKVLAYDSLIKTKPSSQGLTARPADTAMILYTSGTTGRSKGAMLSHENLLANIESLHMAWGHSENDILLHVLPIFHVHGLVVAFHGAVHAGMKIIMRKQFDPADTLACIEKHHCTVFMGVPTLYYRLLKAENPRQFNLDSMRLWISGSAPLPAAVFDRFKQVFGHTILERFGMSETCMNVSNPLNGPRKRGSVGLPLPGVSIRLAGPDESDVEPGGIGEVWVRGKNVMQGYWQMPDKTREAFSGEWLKTGDLGYQDEEGYLYLVGRAKDLVISGGMNIYPTEVEDVIETIEAVEESAVIGIPDDEWGEKVIAVVVPKPNQSVTPEEIDLVCRERLANYKRPKAIYITDKIPRNTMGKILKSQLRESYR
ncbi:MAG: hypothetical protein VR68_15450 [Peptococcaceae bacterium BRH_c4a]|nr:MAG: hypothetical protein VR68_15450 [Peptococcaceae bacterium BRH_c4a]